MTTALATKPLRQVQTVRELLQNDMAKGQLAAVAAKHMNPERMMRLIAGAIRTTPKLADCDPMTLLGAMMTCASIGLEPNTVLGHAYLIPFENRKKGITEITLIIGYKGMIDLARRSGHVTSIHADVVYEGDVFEFEYGSNQHLRHVPDGPRETPTHAYCHAKLTDGEAFIVLPWAVVMGIRDASQGYKTAVKYNKKDSPWIAHVHQMARKTAVRALFNELPISVEKVSDALQVDDTKQDFAAFAMDPTAGIVIEGETVEGEAVETEAETETVDPETGEVTDDEPDPEVKAREDTKEVAAKQEVARKKAVAKPKGPTKAELERQRKAQEKATAEREEQNAKHDQPDQPDQHDHVKSLVLRIKDDLRSVNQGGEIDATLELFAEQLELLRETAPEAFAEIEAEVDAQRERLA